MAEQELYFIELDELFPWLEEGEEEEEEVGRTTEEKEHGSSDRNVPEAVGRHVAKDDKRVSGSVVESVVATSAPVQTEW